jgi:hypothetical protein
MAVTHFIVTKLPDANKINSLKGTDPIALNTLYPIADEATLNFTRVAALDGFYVSDKIYYKAYDEVSGKYSNEASTEIIFEDQDPGATPTSSNVSLQWNNLDSDNLLNLLPISQAVEFVEIVGYSGVLNLKKDNILLLPGSRLTPFELLNSIYDVLEFGGGAPYFHLDYKVGKNDVAEATVYTMDINVDSIAEILLTDQQTGAAENETFDDGAGGTVNYDVIDETIIVDIVKGYQGGTAEFDIVINSPFLTTSNPETQSAIRITINGIETEYIANQTINAVADLDDNGAATIVIVNEIVKDDASETGQIDITLQSINEDISLVSGTVNTVSISTSV